MTAGSVSFVAGSGLRRLLGSGLSNTTWFECFCARRAQKRALLAGRSRLLAKGAGYPTPPGYQLAGIQGGTPLDPRQAGIQGCCTFGVSLLLSA